MAHSSHGETHIGPTFVGEHETKSKEKLEVIEDSMGRYDSCFDFLIWNSSLWALLSFELVVPTHEDDSKKSPTIVGTHLGDKQGVLLVCPRRERTKLVQQVITEAKKIQVIWHVGNEPCMVTKPSDLGYVSEFLVYPHNLLYEKLVSTHLGSRLRAHNKHLDGMMEHSLSGSTTGIMPSCVDGVRGDVDLVGH